MAKKKTTSADLMNSIIIGALESARKIKQSPTDYRVELEHWQDLISDEIDASERAEAKELGDDLE